MCPGTGSQSSHDLQQEESLSCELTSSTSFLCWPLADTWPMPIKLTFQIATLFSDEVYWSSEYCPHRPSLCHPLAPKGTLSVTWFLSHQHLLCHQGQIHFSNCMFFCSQHNPKNRRIALDRSDLNNPWSTALYLRENDNPIRLQSNPPPPITTTTTTKKTSN